MARKGPTPIPWQERFLAKVEVRGPDECWLWTAGMAKNGYGRFCVKSGETRYSHRLAYILWVGPIPDGLDVDHTCHNDSDCAGGPCEHRLCCNPTHLRATTRRENVIAGRGRAGRARSNVCDRGHEFTEENTIRHHGRRSCRTCENAAQRRRYKMRSSR